MAASSVMDEKRRGDEAVPETAGRMSSAGVSVTLLLTALSLAASALGMVSQAVQAHQFGASREMGAYFAAFSVTGMILGMAPAIFSSVVIPMVVDLESRGAEQRAAIATLFAMVAGAAIITTVCGIASEPLVLHLLMPHASPAILALAARVSTLLWLTVGISLVVSFLCAVYLAKRKFLYVGMIPLLPPIMVVTCVLAGGESIGVRSISSGLLLAALLQMALLLSGSREYLGRPSFAAGIMLKFCKAAPPILISLVPFTAAPFIAIFWAERVDVRAVPFFGYCQSVATILSVAVSYGLATTSFPNLARQAAERRFGPFFAVSRRHLQSLLVLAAIAATLLGVCRVPLLKILLSHGAFDLQAVMGTAQLLPWYLAGAVCVACLNFLRNVFYAKGDHWTLALLGMSAPLLFFSCASWSTRLFGVTGIAFSYALGFAGYALLAVTFLRVPGLKLWSGALVWSAVRLTLACLAAASLSEMAGRTLPRLSSWAEGLTLFLIGTASVATVSLIALSKNERDFVFRSPLIRRLATTGRLRHV